jgi:putative hemolysin
MLAAELAIIFLLVLLNGFLAMSELAVVSSRRSRLQMLASAGRRGADHALELNRDPGRFLSTVQVGITLVGIVNGAVSGAALGARAAAFLRDLGVGPAVADAAGYGAVIGTIAFLSVVAGELVPKQLALRNAEAIACLVAPTMRALSRIASPFVILLARTSQALLRLFGARAPAETTVTEDEIRALIAEAESAGVVEPQERRMIAGVMRLGDRPVRAVMTPRMDIDWIDAAAGHETIRGQIRASGHARLAVCDGTPEKLVGIVHAKDMLDALIDGRPFDLAALLHQPPVIPDTLGTLDALERLRATPLGVAAVHDEYGHFEGIVTAMDILAAIAGDFAAPGDQGPVTAAATRRDDGSWLLDGAMDVVEASEMLPLALPAERQYHTLAGLVLFGLKRVPQTGDHVEFDGWRLEVVDMDGRRIDKILAQRLALHRRGTG